MREMRLVATVTIAIVLGLGAVTGCGEKDEPAPAAPAPAATTTGTATVAPSSGGDASPAGDGAPGGGRESVLEQSDVPEPGEDATANGLSRAEREAVATAKDYVAALDARDGARTCALLDAGAIELVKLPRERGGCAASLEASIGYRDPRGLPVWKSAEVEAIASLEVGAEQATVIPTVFTRFADRDQPSVEDDPIYLRRVGNRWLVAKPSLTLYRAIGDEPPPGALAPPKERLG